MKRVIFISRCFVIATRYFNNSRTRQVVSSLQSITQRFITPVIPPVLAISVFGWKSEPKVEAVQLGKEHEEGEALKQADELYHLKEDKKNNEIEVVTRLHTFLLPYEESNNPEFLWRLARASRDLANLSITDETNKKTLIYKAHEYAKRALASGEENFACHKWYAITLSDLGDYEGTKQKISNAYEIQNHFKKAIELNPLDATSYHLLGRWCFSVTDVPWYQRKIASAIFDTPPSSSYEEAIDYFERAERLDPNFYSMNQLMIAKGYLNLSKKPEARQWLEKLEKFDVKTEEDKAAVEEAKELLKKC